jgi:hypothetical protein
MRILGYILLLTAFALIIVDVTIGMGERQAIWLGRTDKALRDSSLPLEHPVANVCIEMNRSWASVHHFIAVPTMVMLVGAIILDLSGRRKGRKQNQEEPQPPAAG